MPRLCLTLPLLLLTACGAETVGGAATAAAAREQEIQHGQALQQRLQADLEAANADARARLEAASKD